jgi:hypothetical protein
MTSNVRATAARSGRRRHASLPGALVACCVASPLLDVVTNVTSYFGEQDSLVALCKGVILMVLLAHLRSQRSLATIAAFVCIHATRELIILLSGEQLELLGDTTFFLRILSLITWLLVFHEQRRNARFMDSMQRIFIVTVMVSVLAGIVGFALSIDFFKAYGDQRNGWKGLFFAENDTSVFYLIALVLAVRRPATARFTFLPAVVASIVLLGLGSKTALLGLLVTPALFMFFQARSSNVWAQRLRAATLYVALPLVVLFVATTLDDLLSAIGYDQLTRVVGETDLLSALLSYRDLKVAALLDSVQSPLDLLVGVNIRNPYGLFGPETSGNHMIEIDLFDYLFRVGLLGILLTGGTMWRVSALKRWRQAPIEFKVLIALILITGMTVGHVLMSAMNTPWIAFFLIRYSTPMRAPARSRRRVRARPRPSAASAIAGGTPPDGAEPLQAT